MTGFHQTQMPLARHPQVGFPARSGSVQETPDHVLTEKLDLVEDGTMREAGKRCGLRDSAAAISVAS